MVSRLVQALERRLNVRLLHRTTQRVAVTEAGRTFYERCNSILAELAEAEAQASNDATTQSGTLRINAPVSFGSAVLAPALVEFSRRFSKVALDVVLCDQRTDFFEGCDVALRVGALSTSSLVARPLGKLRMLACAAPRYLENHGIPACPEDLRQHACLSAIDDCGTTRDAWTFQRDQESVEIPVRGMLKTNNTELLRQAARLGLGVTLQPMYLVSGDLLDGALVRVLEGWDAGSLPINALYQNKRHLPARSRCFIEFLIEHFTRNPPS
jgi:DNA-binding transcriptional LysR family regulator